MSTDPTRTFNPENQLDVVIADFLRAREAGDNPDPEAWIEQHPDLADDLREFFADHERLEEMTQQLRQEQNLERIQYFGDYELHGEIARGGMGVVYRARQVSVNRPVAIKMILTGQLASENDVLRFRNEAELAANLDHPHIVPIYEVGDHEGQHYFSMKLIEGGSLPMYQTRFLQRPHDAAELMIKVAHAIDHAHQRGLLHRDLKPGNVLIDAKGEPHVTDFGLAKRITSVKEHSSQPVDLTQTGAIVGTPAYASPEQVRAEKSLTTAVDVYGLGAVLYYLLTGRAPFEDESTWEIVQQVLTREPLSPRQLNPIIPRDLEIICLKCLQKEPTQRYGSALAFAEDLQRYLHGEPIQARPVGSLERIRKWARRRPSLAASLLLGLVVAVMLPLGVVYYVQKRESDRQRQRAVEEKQQADQLRKKADEKTVELAKQKRESDRLRKVAQNKEKEVQRQRERFRQLAYANQINYAHQLWKEGNAEVAWKVLQETPPAYRNWEYWYLEGLFNRATLDEEAGTVECVAFSPDGQWIVSASPNHQVKVWNARTGACARILKGHTEKVTCVAVSPDGTRIASGSRDKTARVWDFSTGKQLHVLSDHEDVVECIAFSPDGQILASAGRLQSLRLWDVQTGKHRFSFPKSQSGHWIEGIAFSPDGQRVVHGQGYFAKVWNPHTGKVYLSMDEHVGRAQGVAFSPDGGYVVSTDDANSIYLWNARTGEPVRGVQDLPTTITSVAWSPDGRFLACGGKDSMIRVWDAGTGERIHLFRGHTDLVNSVAFSPDSRRLVSCAYSEIKVWDLAHEQESRTFLNHQDEVSCLAFSPEGKWIVSGSQDRALKLWSIPDGAELLTLKGHTEAVRSVAVSPDGQWIVSAGNDKTIRKWNSQTGEELLLIQGHEGSVGCVAISPDGKHILSGSSDHTVRIWDARSGKQIQILHVHTDMVSSVKYSPDGNFLASADRDGNVRMWKMVSGKPVLTLKKTLRMGDVRLAFSPDGSQLVGIHLQLGKIVPWSTSTGKQVTTFLWLLFVRDLIYTPDHKRIITINGDKTISVWNAETGDNLLTIKAHFYYHPCVAVSPDGKLIASGSRYFGVQTWEALRSEEQGLAGHLQEMIPDTRWHSRQAHLSEIHEQWFAAAFHHQRQVQRQPWKLDLIGKSAHATIQFHEQLKRANRLMAPATEK